MTRKIEHSCQPAFFREEHRVTHKTATIPAALLLIALCAFGVAAASGQTNFTVSPNLALQVSIPTKESYQYQAQFKTNLSSPDWLPATGLQVATGTNAILTFSMTNGPSAFYRAQEFLPNLTNRIVGLTNIYFDNTSYSGQGAGVKIGGIRAISRDYTLNDYITAQFAFDLHQQTFGITSLQVYTNLGITCGQFFIKNATNHLQMLNGPSVLNADVLNTITCTGQVMVVQMLAAQALGLKINDALAVNLTLNVADPNGVLLDSQTIPAGSGGYYYTAPIGAYISGAYTVQFIPQGVSSTSVGFFFHNCNGSQLAVLTNSQHFSTSVLDYYEDYTKFQVSLNAGQTIQLATPGAIGLHLGMFNSVGVPVADDTGSSPLFYTAPASGTYYLIVYQNDFTAYAYSSTVSITP
jgi:hypothetical protein